MPYKPQCPGTRIKKSKRTLNHSVTQSQLNFRDFNLSIVNPFQLLWCNRKQTIDALERQKQDKGMVLQVKATDYCSLFIPPEGFFPSFVFLFFFAGVLVTSCSIRWYLQHIQETQVVQLLQDSTSTCMLLHKGSLCLPTQSQERGGDTRSAALT